ncbi:MAG TPA: galactokinase [bacterium]|nr:galactokinase [bacterium]
MDPHLAERARALFFEAFGGEPAVTVSAPGRVNLIGEHTDYNEGFVLPMAVDRGVVMAARRRDDAKVLLHSADYRQRAEFLLEPLRPDPEHPWADYMKGVALGLRQSGRPLGGFEALILGDLPQGAGLSSSAALEVAGEVLLRRLFGFSLDDLELVRLAQKAENEFVGVQCGIMDQFASHLGAQGCALFLDCRSLEYDWVPLGEDLKAVVFNTGVKRELASSDYNVRRQQCAEGVRQFARFVPGLTSLRDLSLCDLEKHQAQVEPLVLKRCRHVVGENQRVLDAVEAFRNRDLGRIKTLFRESHESLRDDYEVSCPELDALVEAAQEHPLQKGSRMTGGGFGGCTVHLVPQDEAVIQNFISFVSQDYEKRFGRRPESYVFSPAAGAKFLNES